MDSAQKSDAPDHFPGSVAIQINGLQGGQAGDSQTRTDLQNASGMPNMRPGVEEPASATGQTSLDIGPAPEPNNDQVGIPTQREGQGQIYQPNPTGSLLELMAEIIVSLVEIFSKGKDPPSRNAKILSYFAVVSNIIGYISFFTRMLMHGRQEGLTTRIVTAIGYAGVAFGFIALLAMRLPDSINLWIALGACALCLSALAAAIKGCFNLPGYRVQNS
ncbi:unnamed protein product [Dovyalis caffra]|uniref:Uncharacterized protein n=1 Tax=Dovyalis caffra TaxID=77055 RepID=A0AAV1QUK8_9ROSI|nr:unnamed protein product [Dovyalis caffra]